MSGPGSYVLLDVFTDTALEGNQLAVFPDGRELAAEQMQRLAAELSLSETAFLLPARAGADARIRIFTPRVELAFAGHPVLGAAVALGHGREQVTLETAGGAVSVALRHDSRSTFGRMRQPIPTWGAFEHEAELLGSLGLARSGLPVEAYRNGPQHLIVALEGEEQVAALEPDMRALAALGELCVSCFAGAGGRFKTRMFAPALGVPEDPATGSAAGPLAVHLARHGRIAFGDQIELRQGAEIGRPSLLYASAHGSAEEIERVEVAGSAVIVARGEFRLD